MWAQGSLAWFVTVSLASLALITARPVTVRVKRAVANDNRTPAGTRSWCSRAARGRDGRHDDPQMKKAQRNCLECSPSAPTALSAT
jgi:hypothetical protein